MVSVSVVSEPRMTPETMVTIETVSPGRQSSEDSDSGVNMPVEREVTINNTPGKY